MLRSLFCLYIIFVGAWFFVALWHKEELNSIIRSLAATNDGGDHQVSTTVPVSHV